jgi:hypothetical protein
MYSGQNGIVFQYGLCKKGIGDAWTVGLGEQWNPNTKETNKKTNSVALSPRANYTD